MQDKDWAKHLSRAQFRANRWQLDDEPTVQRALRQKLENCMDGLFDEANDAVSIFNAHCGKESAELQILRLSGSSMETQGFLLLYGKSQFKLRRCQNGLEGDLVRREEFEARLIRRRTFTIGDDGLGCLIWMNEFGKPVSTEDVIKDILTDLVRCERTAQSR